MLKGMNTEAFQFILYSAHRLWSNVFVARRHLPPRSTVVPQVYGEGHPFGDPSWYQAYNMPYYNDSHKQFQKLMREYVDEHIMSNVMVESATFGLLSLFNIAVHNAYVIPKLISPFLLGN